MISRMVFTISAVRAWQAGTMAVTRWQKGSPQDHPQDNRVETKVISSNRSKPRASKMAQSIKALATKHDGPSAICGFHMVQNQLLDSQACLTSICPLPS